MWLYAIALQQLELIKIPSQTPASVAILRKPQEAWGELLEVGVNFPETYWDISVVLPPIVKQRSDNSMELFGRCEDDPYLATRAGTIIVRISVEVPEASKQ